MTYLVTENCINCKHSDCVVVCPVDCFHEGPNFISINPDECIDCGVCVPECPVDAIKPDHEVDVIWAERGLEFSKLWPKIEHSKKSLSDAELFREEGGKFEKYIR